MKNAVILTTKRASGVSKAVLNTMLAEGTRVFVVLRSPNDRCPSHFAVPGVVVCNPVYMLQELGMGFYCNPANKDIDLYNMVFNSPTAVGSAHYVRAVDLKLSRPQAFAPRKPKVFPFFEEIQRIFQGGKIKYFSPDASAGTLTFEVHEFDIEFEHLEQLSKLLGTRKINFSEKTEYGGCESCGHGFTSFTPIYCKQVQFSQTTSQ